MTRDRILALLTDNRAELERRKVRGVALVGSFARGDAQPDSDVDLLVDLDYARHPSAFDMGGLHDYLRGLFGRDVSLLTTGGLTRRPTLAAALQRDAQRTF